MTDGELMKYLIGQGAFAICFALLLHFYRRDMRQFTDLWRGLSDQLMDVVKDNTASNVRLISLIERWNGPPPTPPRGVRREP